MMATLFPLPCAVPEDSAQDTQSTGYVAIVDDDESACRALARLLGAYSFHVQKLRLPNH
jgi:hypothetical protein